MKKVSIIIPIYNVEKYLSKLIESVLNQTYKNIEIILVDDGSPDKCPSIMDEYAKLDERIIAIHKKNGGVSSARNAGLDIASGDFIMFVDGDDYVDADYVDYFLNLVEKSNKQIGYGKYFYTINNDKTSNEKEIVTSEKAMEYIYDNKIGVAVWNKIYSSKLIKENNVKFNEGIWYGEGMLFNIGVLQYANEVVIGEKATYHQTFNPNSAVNKFNLNSNYCGLSSMWLQRSIWRTNNNDVLKAWLNHKYKYNIAIIEGMTRTNSINNEIYKECIHNIRKDIMIPILYSKGKKEKLKAIAYAVAPKYMARRAAYKFNKTILNTGGGNSKN